MESHKAQLAEEIIIIETLLGKDPQFSWLQISRREFHSTIIIGFLPASNSHQTDEFDSG